MAVLSTIMKKGEITYGKGTYKYGIAGMPDFPRIPTGIFAVDFCTGGGMPIYVTSSLYGGPGGGKSTLMYKIIASAQNICWNCYDYLWDCKCGSKKEQKVVLLPVEQMDTDYTKNMGVNLDNLIVAEPSIGEEGVDIIVECLRAEDCGLVILDSLVGLTPEDELNASASATHVALQARLLSSLMRKVKSILVREKKYGHSVAFMATNQIRSKIGGFGHIKEDVPGGYVSKHDWHMTLRMSQLKSDKIDKETELPLYSKFKASNVAMANKRKCFMMSGSAEYWLTTSPKAEYKMGTPLDYTVVLTYLDRAELLHKSPWFTPLMPEMEFRTKKELMDSWLEDSVFLTLKRRLIQHYVAETKNAV